MITTRDSRPTVPAWPHRNTKLSATLMLFTFGAALLGGCAGSSHVKPFANGAATRHVSEEESRLWLEANEFDDALRRQGAIYDDPAVTAYVQGVMDRLYPSFKGRIHVRILKSPDLNAFALPNGSIYVHLGLLARLENEAELATVLAHEGAHFVDKHGLLQRRNIKSASVFATGMAVAGVPVVGSLAAASSIYGFSRDLEREADHIGYEHLQRAGYDTAQGVKVFDILAAEVKALDVKEPYFFSSHPRLQERIDSFQELMRKEPATGHRIAAQEFLNATTGVRVAALESDLSFDRYKSVLLVLERPAERAGYPPYVDYYLGEAYRRRGDKGDADRALKAYRAAIRAAPGFAPTYRAAGIVCLKRGNHQQAAEYFRAYLRRAPNAADVGYVREYLNQIEHEGVRP